MEIDSRNKGPIEFKVGDEFIMLTIRIGKFEKYEVYVGDEFDEEMNMMFDEYQQVEDSLINYLLLRLRQFGHKVSIKYGRYKVDENDEAVETNYPIEVDGTYKMGRFKITIIDDYLYYLDDDDIRE